MNLVYLINITLIFIRGILAWVLKNSKLSRIMICILSAIQMIFIIGFRTNVGTDFDNYVNIFRNINGFPANYINTDNLEKGYVLLNRVIGFFIGNKPIIFNFIVAFLTIFFIMKAIYDKSYNCFLSIYLFISFCLFYSGMNQSRQLLAIAIGMYSVKYLEMKKYINFIIYVLIAASIHSSAIILLVLIPLSRILITRRVLVKYFIVTIIIIINVNLIINLLQYTKYSIYFGSKYDVTQGSSVMINTLFRVVLLIGILLFIKKVNSNKYNNILYHMAILCTILQILAINTSLFARITTYFFVAYIFLIPEILRSIKSKEIRILSYIATIILFGIYHFIYFSMTKNSMGVAEYFNIFFVN